MFKKIIIFLISILVSGLIPNNFSQAQNLADGLKGRILLQVEKNGEAWYVEPEKKQRAFLGRPDDAFRVMRELGLGISEKDFASFGDRAPSRLSGKILLRVEANGEAYYINPLDFKMYFLGRPTDAFDVMRNLGLGIKNKDLDTIPVFDQYGENKEDVIFNILTAHFINVGQGDSTLFQGPDFTILIDAGEQNGNEVVSYLEAAGISSIDLLIGTHPHADHIGQFSQVLDRFPVETVWLSGNQSTSLTFAKTINAISSSSASYYEPRAGFTKNIGFADIKVFNPMDLSGDLNNDSIVVKIGFDEIYFLLTGDIEKKAEEIIINQNYDLGAQILKVGHHGSRTSSGFDFLQKVDPQVAIYSAGVDNVYGHPHDEALSSLSQAGAEIYGTDINGTIKIISDGKSYKVETSQGEAIKWELIEKQEEETKSDCVNINFDSIENLKRIFHIDEERANSLIELRPFILVDELTKINGIGQARLNDIKEQGLVCL